MIAYPMYPDTYVFDKHITLHVLLRFNASIAAGSESRLHYTTLQPPSARLVKLFAPAHTTDCSRWAV